MTSRLTVKESCRKPSRVVSGRILAAAPLSTRHTVISLTHLLGLLSADGMLLLQSQYNSPNPSLNCKSDCQHI
jgi:hypothetical protein